VIGLQQAVTSNGAIMSSEAVMPREYALTTVNASGIVRHIESHLCEGLT